MASLRTIAAERLSETDRIYSSADPAIAPATGRAHIAFVPRLMAFTVLGGCYNFGADPL